eukprot:g1830.t1
MEKANGRLAILVFYVILAGAASQRFTIRGAVASAESSTFVLPLANVSLIGPNAAKCTPLSLLTSRLGTFEFSCAGGAPKSLSMIVWARQYIPRTLTLSKFDFLHVALAPRPIPGFPGKLWRFDGWAVEAETGDVPGTNISFLSHPSAFRTPSGRIFLISTAGSTTGQKPGWTQGYWQSEDGVRAVACKGPLISESHPGVEGVSMSARLIYADDRLFMVTGIEKPSQHRMVTILENKNIEDPSHSEDWFGLGVVKVDFTGAPTSAHEDYRLHILEESYGSLYKGGMSGPLMFDMLPEKIVEPAPRGEWDDLGQVALTFLLPDRFSKNRARLYHASYSTVGSNPNATKVDFGYKLAIGMYSFEWEDA